MDPKINTPTNDRALQKFQTGIKGLDEVLGGGIPAGRAVMVTGGTGSGKSVLLNEFLYRGITEFNQAGVFITFEEEPEDIITNVSSFHWNYPELIAANKLTFVDFSDWHVTVAQSGDFTWDVLIMRIELAIKKTDAKRVVIDSLTTAFSRYHQFSENKIRELVFTIKRHLKKMGVTALISTENPNPANSLSRYSIEEFVADGLISLHSDIGQSKIRRYLNIVKMRGVGYRSGRVEFEISSKGIEVYPKIPIDTSMSRTDFKNRKSTGLAALDEAMNGGVPEGHMMLIGGNTGTGKTTLAMHFIMEGFKRGENAIWVALEEPVPQVIKTAEAHGWDLNRHRTRGELAFVRVELLDISTDKLMYEILHKCEEIGAKRVVIDSISSIESSLIDSESVREFLIMASTYFKTKGICCFMNYLNHESFGTGETMLMGTIASNDMRLSSIVDGILLMRYVERQQQVQLSMNIFKLRGSKHSRDIIQYTIGQEGIIIGKRFKPFSSGE